jgi:hypothetical protein
MKNLILITLFFISSLSCKSQIIPIEKEIEYQNQGKSYPAGTNYIKDVNNLLDKYTGTWKGALDGINYEIQVIKATTQFQGMKSDNLFIKMYITKTDGTVLEDTRALPIDNLDVIQGRYLNGLVYNLTYYGRDYKCGQSGDVFIQVVDNSNGKQLRVSASWDHIGLAKEDCPNGRTKLILPKKIILNKQ